MIEKIKNLYEYFKYLNNPLEALLFKIGLKKECRIKIKNSDKQITLHKILSLNRLMTRLPVMPKEKYNQFLNYIKDIDNDKKIISIDDIDYYNVYNTDFKKTHEHNYNTCIEELISDDTWDVLDINNRFIIDIGGNAADTALYFAKNNATVIGFEPVKHLYDLALENISLNQSLKNKITFINKAVGGKSGKINISTDSTDAYRDNENSYDVEVITIPNILNDYKFPADILKMDCEGCEFEIIPDEDLSMFSDIILEHHSRDTGKDYRILIKSLEKQGFKINTYPVNITGLDFEDIGIIHAFKQ